MFDFLRKVPLFSDLPEDDLDMLCQMAEEISLKAGEELFPEGSTGDKAYVVREGQLEVFKNSGGRNVLLNVSSSGDVIGEMALLESTPRTATVRARTDSRLISIGAEPFNHLINTSPSAARTMLHTVSGRLRSSTLILNQSEKMAQIGTLTAGIAHELNNPAAAARRGAEQLRSILRNLESIHLEIGQLKLSDSQLDKMHKLEAQATERAGKLIEANSLHRSDRQEEIETWLEERGIDDAWELAPTLTDLDCKIETLVDLAELFPGEMLSLVLNWWGITYTAQSLLMEISQGTTRIGEIVQALKSYVYLDQAEVQWVDLHEGLENTLVILRSKLKKGVTVHRDYDPNLPKIQAHGSELNQVWTNLIDNAVEAMDGEGDIYIRTHHEQGWVTVEIEDNGPGIPKEIQTKVFNPFFTTKSVGKGTGMGLNISYNIVNQHAGVIRLNSHPGKTIFQICLPVNFETAESGAQPPRWLYQQDDDTLRSILENTHTIAVVGISARPEVPAHSVPAYLQRQGYQLLPVNPNLDEVLGRKAYPDLLSIPGAIDMVLIFRRSEAVPEIVDQAIQVGAKTIWMQEGISNEQAAISADAAGLQVVMNMCARATHIRLFGDK
jgi:signal transduction histidine kinase/predicted CoA-binding protein